MVRKAYGALMSLAVLITLTTGCVQGTPGKISQAPIPAAAKDDPGRTLDADTAAIVNGEIVSVKDFERRTAKKKFVLEAQGHSFSGSTRAEAIRKLRESVIKDLIQERVMLQEAAKEGVKISDQQVESVLAEIKSAFPSEQAFRKTMAARGLTEEAVKNYNRMKLTGQALAEKHPGDYATLMNKWVQEAKVQVNEQVIEEYLQSI